MTAGTNVTFKINQKQSKSKVNNQKLSQKRADHTFVYIPMSIEFGKRSKNKSY